MKDFVMLTNDKGLDTFPAALCVEHFWLLKQAGTKGKVHAKTGLRWWLAEQQQEGQSAT